MIDNNAVFRRQPLNYNQAPHVMSYHRNGILTGVRPTPPQFFSMQSQNMADTVNSRREFWRVTTKDNVGNANKFIPPVSSSDIVSKLKRNAIGRSSYYSRTGEFSTKNYYPNDSRTATRMARSGGSSAPKKKGAK